MPPGVYICQCSVPTEWLQPHQAGLSSLSKKHWPGTQFSAWTWDTRVPERVGRLGEGGRRPRHRLPISFFFFFLAVTPLPALPEPTPKAVYPLVRPSLYLPLWDALQYLNSVSTACFGRAGWLLRPQSRDPFMVFLLERVRVVFAFLQI